MLKQLLRVNSIPVLLWGNPSEKIIFAVHGNMSHKADVPIKILAQKATKRGYQVLSFDLPEHGDRKGKSTLSRVEPCIEDLEKIMVYARPKYKSISLFANSIGAYFSLLAYKNEALEKALFLSPVLDMQRIIENMMLWFKITEEQLKIQQTIPTPMGQNLYWDYYTFVKAHPITKWQVPTSILYGEKDILCERDVLEQFARQFSCQVEEVPHGEHFFHSSDHLVALGTWLDSQL